MNTIEFLRRILPERGLYVIGHLAGKQFVNEVYETIEHAAAAALYFDANGAATYHACAAYRERSVLAQGKDGRTYQQIRVQRNVRALRSFWMDLDVEPGNEKKFESQEAACDGLVKFIAETNLPMPMVVSSGYGIHIYWTLEDEIQPETWKQTAEGLKRLTAHYKFKADPACTCDSARMLRPVATFNRKLTGTPRPVQLIDDPTSPLAFERFRGMVHGVLQTAGVKPPEGIRSVVGKTEAINQGFEVETNFPPCSIIKVADKCAQIRKVRDTRGCVSEPTWYNFVQVACHSIEGDLKIHEWSSGHANYSEAETKQKIHQIRNQNIGPTLCTTFRDNFPDGCTGCPFEGKVASPAQLGTQVVSAPPPVIHGVLGGVRTEPGEPSNQVIIPNPPLPFTRGKDGGIYLEEEGITHKIYEHDLYPVEMAYDEKLGYETTRWRHFLPQEGWKECTLRSSLLARPVDFETALRDHHIQPLIRNKIAMYADAYIRKLRSTDKMRQLFKCQGWKKDDTEFVLGEKLYRKDEVVQAGFSHGLEEFLAPFHQRGSLDVWKGLTSVLDHKGFEPHAFMLLLAFASPLLKLAGRQGFTVNALGMSGSGKSTMAMFMSSVYGTPMGAWVGRKDTELARMQRLGAHYSLPVYMDEATTILGKELRDMVYMIPTGKSRSSMTQDYKLRPGAEWATIFVTSTNDSLQSKLQLEKQNAEAESLRLFEFRFPRVAEFGPISKMIPPVIADNYGVAGAAYVQGLVSNRDSIKARLLTVVDEAEHAFGMDDKERFWSQAVALTLYAGDLAKEWGIIEFDPQRLRPWLLQETKRMRGALNDTVVDAVAILGQYINEHMGGRLTVTSLNVGMTATNTKPMREISQRYEKDKNLLFFPAKHVKDYLGENHFLYEDVKLELLQLGILLSANTKRTLGAGTDFTGSPVFCWSIKTNHAMLNVEIK